MTKAETARQALTEAIESVTGEYELPVGTLFGNAIFDTHDLALMLSYLERNYDVVIDAVEDNIDLDTRAETLIKIIEERL